MGKENKEKKVKISDKEAEKILIDYLKKQNRPYNALMVFENLHGVVGKKQAINVLASLGEDGKIATKEFGKQKLYWTKQDDIEAFDQDTLIKLDKTIETLEQERNDLNEQLKELSNDIRAITATPTDEESNERILALTNENTELEARLSSIKGNQVVITKEEKKQAEQKYDHNRQMWRKRKRLCKEICGQLEEGTGKRQKEIKEELGLEFDEDQGVSIDKDETSKLKRGEV